MCAGTSTFDAGQLTSELMCLAEFNSFNAKLCLSITSEKRKSVSSSLPGTLKRCSKTFFRIALNYRAKGGLCQAAPKARKATELLLESKAPNKSICPV